MRNLLTGLPVAGVSGSLATRYQVPGSSAGAGWVRAKTGSLEVTYALAGYVPDVDGRILVFAFVSNGVDPDNTRPALDAVAAGLRGCGCL
jgi:D-alanyl-D-alanine carboxypeptidase/D-alanyl-D-alanine-endopeptidase (penicillin-binding protein 4)